MPRGGFGRGFGRGFGMRRYGAPLVYHMGMGGGSPLLNTLMAGGLGYLLGSSSAQQAAPQPQQVAAPPPPYPPYPYPYQAPPAAPQGPTPTYSADNGKLAQLQLLGQLHDSGVLTDDEFESQKQRILRS